MPQKPGIAEEFFWEAALTGHWFAGPLSAVDFTLYPELASSCAWRAATPVSSRKTSWR
jgi:hypothetical protein